MSRAWLLTWNPHVFPFPAYDDLLHIVQTKGYCDYDWSVRTGKPVPGDIFYLMKVGCGKENGIVGYGEICSAPKYESWFDLNGKVHYSYMVDIRILRISDRNHPFVYQADLKNQFPEQCWSPQSSGIAIRQWIRERLFEAF